MKIFVGGMTTIQQQSVQKAYPHVEFVFCSADDSAPLWGSRLGNSEAIIVMSKFNKHKHINVLKSKSDLPINFANGGVSSVIGLVGDLLRDKEDEKDERTA